MAKPPVSFWKASDVRDIAESLIPDFHPHLAEKTILYVFRSEASEKKGRVVLGTARKVSGLNAYLAFRDMLESQDLSQRLLPALTGEARQSAPAAPSFYVIEIAHDTWLRLEGPQRIALVDHELAHIGDDGMVGHDVEEFREVIERHGLWKPDLKEFAKAMRQTPLFQTVSHSGSATVNATGVKASIAAIEEIHDIH
jgi:hypothetical protein